LAALKFQFTVVLDFYGFGLYRWILWTLPAGHFAILAKAKAKADAFLPE